MGPDPSPTPGRPEGVSAPWPVDVVVVTWNDGPLLGTAVSSALASEGVAVTVHVVDNGSTPPAVPPPDPRVHLIRNEENRGVAPARNQGVAAGGAPYVALLDSDARLHPHTLARLVAALTPGVGLAAPVFDDQAPEASAGSAPGLTRKAARVLGLTDTYASTRPADATVWEVEFAIGACQVFRRRAFEDVGGLDESIFYGPEDVDFCLRLRAAGWRSVQVAAATCHHPPRRRNRRLLSRRGLAHGHQVLRYAVRHRRC